MLDSEKSRKIAPRSWARVLAAQASPLIALPRKRQALTRETLSCRKGSAALVSFTLMRRRLRVSSGGYACFVLNWAVGWSRIFGRWRDFEEMEEGSGRAKG